MARTNGTLSPSHSPSRVRRAQGTRRINGNPLFIALGIGALIVFAIFMMARHRGELAASKPQDDDHGGSTSVVAAQVAGPPDVERVPAAAAASPAPQGSATPLPASTTGLALPDPTPDDDAKRRKEAFLLAMRAQTTVDGHADRIAQQRLQQQQAQQANVQRANLVPSGAAGTVDNGQEVGAAYRQSLAQAQSMVGPNGEGAFGNGQLQPNPNDLAAFNGDRNRWALASRREYPKTPYVLEPGSIIPAVLETAINSDLPGVITARVSKNVYDTPTGRYLLLPMGSLLIGQYASQVSYGQSRVFIAYQRINFPDGSWMDLGSQPGVDGQGVAGAHDQTDVHLIRTFGSALLMSAISAGFTLGQGGTNGGGYGYGGINASQTLSESLGQHLGNAASMMLEKNLNVSPTLKIRSGFRTSVMCVRDLTFSGPYRSTRY